MSKTVVITGSTRGIGYGMAQAFLERGNQVVVSGRQQTSADQAAASLAAAVPGTDERILAHACDIGRYEQVQALWDAAVARFGRVDIWINNAARAAAEIDFWEHDPAVIDAVLRTNINGTFYACHVAAKGMLEQGSGFIYNMEGWGSGGETSRGSALYGATKAADAHLTKTLQLDLADTPVRLASINPGMVVTDMLVDSVRPGREENMRRIVNILGDTVDTVSPWLVDKMLANDKHGARILWLKPVVVFWRFLTARFRSRDIAGELDFSQREAAR
jgi:NAD(P)-dependent dehydrogenase (short-subunit alcohol dehydrogenase family)